MNTKGLSAYRALQPTNTEHARRAQMEVILKKATLYNVAFLQNETLLAAFAALPQIVIPMQTLEQTAELLLWLDGAQEKALLSH